MPSSPVEIRDTDEARRFIVQSLWLQRVLKPSAETVLTWCLEIAFSGQSLLPPGFVADCGHLVFGAQSERDIECTPVPGISSGTVREYEDYVLGKLYADSSFERGSDALSSYGSPRDRAKGLSFLLGQMANQTEFGGVIVSQGVIRELERAEPSDVLAEGWQTLADEISPDIVEQYSVLIHCVRNTGDTLAPEDVFELEHKTALAGFGPRVALRQMLNAANLFRAAMPTHYKPGRSQHHSVTSNLLDEDTYPVGGFTSISNRGSVESLLHSQLAYMETDEGDQPDLFDIKFLRDELLYYSRDENQFFRRRRTFVFALFPSLVETRVKDADLPYQRIILTLALIQAVIEKLIEWLSEEALKFEILLPDSDVLATEAELIEMVFREQVLNGTIVLQSFDMRNMAEHCQELSRRSQCHGVTVFRLDQTPQVTDSLLTRLVISDVAPRIGFGNEPLEDSEGNTPMGFWMNAGIMLVSDLA